MGWTFRHPKPGPTHVPNPRIRFLGLWDTVGSFGVPIGPLRNRSNAWFVRTIPENVARSFHAMALDEVRPTFSLIRPQHKNPKHHYEVWFRGIHSNIGGGYLERGLSDIPLAWMFEMYLWTLEKEGGTPPSHIVDALRMLQPEPGPPPSWVGRSFETVEPDCDGELGRSSDTARQGWRAMPAGALVHHSVFRRSTNIVLDHARANRRLLRQIPGDARAVYDPPFFYSDTPRAAARRIAEQAFSHVPVRATTWLTLHEEAVYRSDHWIAVGRDRANWTVHARRDAFIAVATEWLLSGKPSSPPEGLPETFKDKDGKPVKSIVVAAWVIEVLAALEPYVLALREHYVEKSQSPNPKALSANPKAQSPKPKSQGTQESEMGISESLNPAP
jgi:hypothetical protein